MHPGKTMALELTAAFAHGIQGVIFYRWEPLLSGPEPWINGMIEVDDYDTERRLTLKEGIAGLKEYEEILDNGKSRKARVGIFLRRDHIIYANENGLDIDREMTGIYALLSDSGYEADAVLDEFDPKCDYEAMVFPYTHIDEDLSAKVKEYADADGKALFALPTSDAGVAAKIAAGFGIKVEGIDRPNYWFIGWDLRGEDNVFRGFGGHERLILEEGNYKTLLTYGNDGRSAIISPQGYEDNIMIFSFPLGRTYRTMLHWGMRNLVGDFLGSTLKPDIVIKGVHQELRAIVEARVLETEIEGVLFVINRGVYEHDVEIEVSGYKPLKAKLPIYSATKYRLEKVSA